MGCVIGEWCSRHGFIHGGIPGFHREVWLDHDFVMPVLPVCRRSRSIGRSLRLRLRDNEGTETVRDDVRALAIDHTAHYGDHVRSVSFRWRFVHWKQDGAVWRKAVAADI